MTNDETHLIIYLILSKAPEATADFQRQTNSGILETVKQNAIVLQPESKAIYKVIYGKRTTKKNKTFQDDGTLEIVANDAILKDNNGKQVTTVTHKWSQIEDGEQLLIGSYEMEIVEHIAGPKINFQIKEQAVDIISTSKDRVIRIKFVFLQSRHFLLKIVHFSAGKYKSKK